jgi:Chemoreceptor zinc-binding domain
LLTVDNLSKAIAAHSGWKARLRSAVVSGKSEIPMSTVRVDNQCDFGKWLYGSELSEKEKATEHHRNVKRLHADFHREAARVLELLMLGKKGDAEQAIAMGGSYTKASTTLIEAMIKWRDSTS